MRFKSLLLSMAVVLIPSVGFAGDVKDVCSPVTMRVYLPDKEKATGRAVVALPGGAYRHLAIDREGYNWAPFFNDRGIAYIVASYRMPQGNPDIPVADAEAAVKAVRDSAGVWNINPADVGIMGSSAGGHLASTVATHSKGNARPDFQILFYPLITMEGQYTHALSRKNFLGDNPSQTLIDEYSNDKKVTSDTPRAFMVFCNDDTAALPINGALYYTALVQNNVPVSFHVYPDGGHGWGFLPHFRYHSEMRADLSAWLMSF